ncbi:hypothetical protein SCB71_18420 [Herbiconiux sp. KACC 21604]|nr:hypothetical protein [Herbiconiux sp. SALV-R1]WPO86171.1 hypothetical protein SCB71_18420 [Herbiconiux sp. KACC 21604]
MSTTERAARQNPNEEIPPNDAEMWSTPVSEEPFDTGTALS